MNCSECGGPTSVIDSRLTDAGVRRRRFCAVCEHRFSTLEVMADTLATRTIVRAQPAPKRAKPIPTKKQRGEVRRKIEDKLEQRRYTSYDVWTPDNDYLPDY